MSQIGQLAIYALWVASSFAFIAFVPADSAVLFLATYATGSLMVSLFSILVYTSWRNRSLDLLVVAVSILSIVGVFLGVVTPAYWMAAVALNIADFSISQAGRPKAVMVSRLLAGLCALFLIIDFALALYIRLAVCAATIGWSMLHKQYSGHEIIRIDNQKMLLTVLTCTFYYGPLIISPYFAEKNTKIVYIAYSIMGSVILKMHDFTIKGRVAGADLIKPNDSQIYYAICAISGIVFFTAMFLLNPWYCFLLSPILVLIASIRIVNNVSWA